MRNPLGDQRLNFNSVEEKEMRGKLPGKTDRLIECTIGVIREIHCAQNPPISHKFSFLGE
jgi:hypothetical protein